MQSPESAAQMLSSGQHWALHDRATQVIDEPQPDPKGPTDGDIFFTADPLFAPPSPIVGPFATPTIARPPTPSRSPERDSPLPEGMPETDDRQNTKALDASDRLSLKPRMGSAAHQQPSQQRSASSFVPLPQSSRRAAKSPASRTVAPPKASIPSARAALSKIRPEHSQ